MCLYQHSIVHTVLMSITYILYLTAWSIGKGKDCSIEQKVSLHLTGLCNGEGKDGEQHEGV